MHRQPTFRPGPVITCILRVSAGEQTKALYSTAPCSGGGGAKPQGY